MAYSARSDGARYGGLGLAAGVQAAMVGAILLIPSAIEVVNEEFVINSVDPTIEVTPIEPPPPPEPRIIEEFVAKDPVPAPPRQFVESTVDRPSINVPTGMGVEIGPVFDGKSAFPLPGGGGVVPKPAPDPVITGVGLEPRFADDMQPSYPLRLAPAVSAVK